ncbi:hypothetical protein [Thiomicrorhabdus sp.]|uniref:hypothetical protein n=1 Tax=Thiomicrorhabdus sp. TaxID=2039724 RepID=UPI00356A4A22
MNNNKLPDLRIRHDLVEDHKTRFELKRFAFLGGADVNSSAFTKDLNSGKYYELIPSRIDLLSKIKEELESSLISGHNSLETVQNKISVLKKFFIYCDGSTLFKEVSVIKLKEAYLTYSDHLFVQTHTETTKNKASKNTIYEHLNLLGNFFGKIINHTGTPLFKQTRLSTSIPRTRKKLLGKAQDQQNLSEVFKFGSVLFDICTGITKDKILGTLPTIVQIRNGVVHNNQIFFRGILLPKSEIWVRHSYEELKEMFPQRAKSTINALVTQAKKAREPSRDIKSSGRHSIFNSRIRAEFLVFLAMTNCNTIVAKNLKRHKYDYKPLGDVYQIREWKARKGGNVILEIPKSYKPMFEAYLEFRDDFVKDYPMKGDDWLFPIIIGPTGGKKHKTHGYSNSVDEYKYIRKLFKEHNIPWFTGRNLRPTFLNLLYRKSGDENLTAEQASHLKQTFREHYDQPSLQRSLLEITRFWNQHDPIQHNNLTASVINSPCGGIPEATENKPKIIVDPNCTNPSGCLWCKHFRDLDEFDYVWSLLSFRHLKIIESSISLTSEEKPSDLVVMRLNEKIHWFRKISTDTNHSSWVEEAEERLDEGSFHPDWSVLIELLDGNLL